MIDAIQRGRRRLPLVSAPGRGARPGDLALLLGGRLDLARIVTLARALMAIRWERVGITPSAVPAERAWPDEPWIALRLTHLARPLSADRAIPTDDAIIRRLASGDGTVAVDLAIRRLRACGLRPPVRASAVDSSTARLWVAALAFPIDHHVARAMARRFEPANREETR